MSRQMPVLREGVGHQNFVSSLLFVREVGIYNDRWSSFFFYSSLVIVLGVNSLALCRTPDLNAGQMVAVKWVGLKCSRRSKLRS